MKLYYFAGDWQLPGQQAKGADRVEVPTDAGGLCHWLNARKVPIALALEPAPGAAVFATEPAPERRAPVPAAPSGAEATAFEDFILNRATVAECERIFACLGNRFAESRR